VLADLGDPQQVISSANGTWIDRAELLAMGKSQKSSTVSTLYGHIAEAFSAGPLLSIAAALASRRLPRMLTPHRESSERVTFGRDCPPIGSPFGVLCTDYSGVVSGATIAPLER